ncbi:MAG: amidohydrolase family protein [Chloroflexota bacterium]
MIVDSHMHIFPPLYGPCGFATEQEHDLFLQLYIATHGEPVRRLSDGASVPEAGQALHDGQLTGPEGLLASANFRVGRFGRFEWDWQGQTYYRSFLPPHLQDMVSPPEFILQQMQRAGVDVAVLQNARLYGRLNQYFAEAMDRYPGKFIGLADVVEAEADTEAERARLRDAVERLGLRGIYYANRGLITCHYRYGLDDERFEPYWAEVERLGIPIFWELQGLPLPSPESFLAEVERLNRWCDRHPGIPSVFTHGFPRQYLVDDLVNGLPEPIARLLRREQITVEVLFPIHWGRDHEYPYPELAPAPRRLYDLVGPKRLIWGSDMPNVERNCTYRQSLQYLRTQMSGIASAGEMDDILGNNTLRLLRAA